MESRRAILAANEAFYQAFRSGDFPAMETIWSMRDDVSIQHPNWPGIIGRNDVLASMYEMMMMSEPPPIFVQSPTVVRTDRVAMVFCTELIGAARLTASNVFVFENLGWRLTCHHARQLPLPARTGQHRGGNERGLDND